MLRRRFASLLGFLTAAAVTTALVTTLSATNGCSVCDCALPGVTLSIPPERSPRLAGVVANGETCIPTILCSNGPNSRGAEFSTTCTITVSRAGTCRIEAVFTDGSPTFTRDVVFTYRDGCCSGFAPEPGSALLEVPSIDRDAGVADADVSAVEDAASE